MILLTKIIIILVLSYVAWSYVQLYISILKKSGRSYEKLTAFPKIMLFFKYGIPVLVIYLLFLIVINIYRLFI